MSFNLSFFFDFSKCTKSDTITDTLKKITENVQNWYFSAVFTNIHVSFHIWVLYVSPPDTFCILHTLSEEYPTQSLFRPNVSGGYTTFHIRLKQFGEHLTGSLNHSKQSGAHLNDQGTKHCGAHPTHRGTSPESCGCPPHHKNAQNGFVFGGSLSNDVFRVAIFIVVCFVLHIGVVVQNKRLFVSRLLKSLNNTNLR